MDPRINYKRNEKLFRNKQQQQQNIQNNKMKQMYTQLKIYY